MAETIIHPSVSAPEAQIVLDGLAADYGRLYGTSRPGGARADIDRYPAAVFVPPLGDFLVLLDDGVPVAAGAFMSHDDETAEIKRVWTHPDRRRQGLARRIMVLLEDGAARLGYTRAYLSTGCRQPEAVGLYRSIGYRPLFDTTVDPELYRSLGFEKHIGAKAGQQGRSPIRQPAASYEDATAAVGAIKAAQEERILRRLAAHTALPAVA